VRLSLPLRRAIPASLAAMGLVLTGAQLVHDRITSFHALEDLTIRRTASISHLAVSVLERELGQGDAATVEGEVARLALMPQLSLATVSDPEGRVLYSPDYRLRDRPLSATPAAAALIARARTAGSIQAELTPDRSAVRVATPFYLAALPGELRPSRVGVLYVETDLLWQKQQLTADIAERALLTAGLTLLGCLLVWLFLRKAFTRDLDRLTAALADHAAGRGALRLPEEGSPELATIGRVLNQRLAELAANHAALRESEEKFARIFQGAPALVTLSELETGRLLEVNEESCRVTGFAREELVGRSSLELGWFTPEVRARMVQMLEARGRVSGLDLKILTKEGQLLECLLHGELVTIGGKRRILSIMQDISELRWAERALRESEAGFRLMAENSTDMISRHAPDGTYLYASPACRRILGYEPEELLGHSAYEWVHPEDFGTVRQSHARIFASPEVSAVTFRARRKDGSLVWLEGTSHALRDPATGAVTEVQVALRDVSERVRADEERARLQSMLLQAQKMEAVGHLAGGVAHDFNNILTAMLMNVDALQGDRRLPADVREGLRELEDDSRRAASLTRQLLTFSRRQVMQVSRVELNELLANLLRMLGRLIGEAVTIELAPCDGRLWLQADPGMLEQAVTNMVVNARDAMPGGGRIALRTRAVAIDSMAAARNPEARVGPVVCLEVEDTGMGMDEDTARHAFEPFFTTKEVGKGTGLGLATVYGIVKQHDGWIELDTAPGRGTSLRLFFPAEQAPAATLDDGDALRARGRGERVLVVEDEAGVRRTVVRTLTRLGYQVVEAASGAQALERWAEAGADLLVSDMVMPGGMNGLELAERLRRERPGLRVLLMSGYSPDLADAEALERAAMHHLPKPFEARALARRVREALDAQ
jgi:PAS domain S-box-containing protein